ncbi:MAG: sigma 54-interacting transcriptional regulator, partial [Rhodothermales bacterium]|nr:sigma 54-interacting transcriptional regulator [Rhodothermales bacterium]
MNYTRTIALARGLLAEGRSTDVARMIEPLLAPLHETVPEHLPDDQVLLRALLARVRLLHAGDPPQARALLAPFDAAARRATLAPAVRAEVALWLGWTHAWHHTPTYDDARALVLLDEAEHLFRDAANAPGRCWAFLGRAFACFTIDEHPLMQRALDEAAALQPRVQDAAAACWMLDVRTLAYHVGGAYTQALASAAALAEQGRRLNDPFARARARAYEAALLAALGRPPAAVAEAAEDAVQQLRTAATRPGYALLAAYHARALAEWRRGSWTHLPALLDEADHATRDLPTAPAHWHLEQVYLATAQGRYGDAAARLQDVRAHLPHPQHRRLAADAALVESDLADAQGDPDQALAAATRALQHAQDTGHEPRQLRARLALARLALARQDLDEARRHLAAIEPLGDLFGVLPLAAERFAVLGLLAAEGSDDDARAHLGQALTAHTLVGDAYGAAQTQVLLARADARRAPAEARAHLDAACRTFEQLGAHPALEAARTLRATGPDAEDGAPPLPETTIGAALARAALSEKLVAETWLAAAARLLPDRWMGFYRCDEGQGWHCVLEHGEAPTVPRFDEPCGPRLLAGDVLWLRLRGHPGPAYFFGVRLRGEDDPAWQAAFPQMKPWLPVASLALEHALLRAGRLAHPTRSSTAPLDGLVYASPAMHDVAEQIRRVAASHGPVLVTGERGAGKETAARALHAASPRRAAPFVVVQGAALADSAVAGTLFDLAAPFARAAGGTLFLDAVDALPRDAQRALLQFLRSGALPSADAPGEHSDERRDDATCQDLGGLARDGACLGDLYYRLAV